MDGPVDLTWWLAEIRRLERGMRPATPYYARFDRIARLLDVPSIRAAMDRAEVERLAARLRAARYPTGFGLLDRVWSRAELGELIVEATNRGRQLLAGARPRPKGPRLDPERLPDDRLAWLIQHHPSLDLVDSLRAERRQRDQAPAY